MNTAMTKTMGWLVRKELWENKGSMIRAPLWVGALVALVALVGAISMHAQIGPVDLAGLTADGDLAQGLDVLAKAWPLLGAPLLGVVALTVFFYSLGAMFDERSDRSIAFWKSLPLSDGQVVASKAVVALVVAPAIALAVVLVASLFALLVLCVGAQLHGVSLFGVFARPQTYLTVLGLAAWLPVQALWALPTVGWLMLVGASARGKPFLWAILLPLGLVMAGWLLDVGVALDNHWTSVVASRLLLGTVPGGFLTEGSLSHGNGFVEIAMNTLVQPGLWVGAATGVAMLVAASFVRRRQGLA